MGSRWLSMCPWETTQVDAVSTNPADERTRSCGVVEPLEGGADALTTPLFSTGPPTFLGSRRGGQPFIPPNSLVASTG